MTPWAVFDVFPVFELRAHRFSRLTHAHLVEISLKYSRLRTVNIYYKTFLYIYIHTQTRHIRTTIIINNTFEYKRRSYDLTINTIDTVKDPRYVYTLYP